MGPQGDDHGAGQSGHIDDAGYILFGCRVVNGVCQCYPPLGIGVANLNGFAGHGPDNVSVLVGFAGDHILAGRYNGGHVPVQLAGGNGAHGADDGSGSAHVGMHGGHAGSRLQSISAGIIGQSLADQSDGLLILGGTAVAHDDKFWFPG
ncbi:hypothetical protein SDC9_160640 [bioreactor metagenome]|uniref:Uncharacterized protein n=1 Tax=bioreactor metagenome TaxID=1076179 RepID=A0A645FIZ4_9ZZZZ